MAQDSIILPEISADNFEHAWKRFRLAAVAKQWQAEKQLLILPTLLRGNLVDYYMDLGEDEKRSLEDVKQALERQLRHMLERMSKKFESFEQQLKELDAGRATDNNSVERERRSSEKRVSFKLQCGSSQEDGGGRRRNTCFLCGKEGHWKRECTLNFNGSAPTVDGGWRERK